MSYYQVSDENFQKVENFFVQKIKETGVNRVEAKVVEIAEGSGVALATAHNAIKQMVAKRILTVIKPSSRRFPITYIYNSDVTDFEAAQSKEEQLLYLQNRVRVLTEQLERSEAKYRELEGQYRILQNRIGR